MSLTCFYLLFIPQPVLTPGFALPKCSTSHLVTLNFIPMGPLVNHTTQLGAIIKFGRLHSIPSSLALMRILNNTDPNMDPGWILLITDAHWDSDSLTTTLWMWPPNHFLIQHFTHKSISFYFRQKDVVEDYDRGFMKVQISYVWNPSLLHWCSYSIIEDHWVGQAGFALHEAMLTVSNHLPILHVPWFLGESVPWSSQANRPGWQDSSSKGSFLKMSRVFTHSSCLGLH